MPGRGSSRVRGLQPLGPRRINSDALEDVGVDAGYRFGNWTISVSLDYATATDVMAWIGGENLNLSEPIR